MLRTATIAFVVALTFLARGSVLAGKIVIDPNLKGETVVEEQNVLPPPLDADKRLDKKITYEAQRKPVRDIVADIAKLSGVTLRAGTGREDWQVRDRKMDIFAKDLQVRDLMTSIARVMKFEWTATGDKDNPVYRLLTDAKAMQEEAARRAKRLQKQEQVDAEKRHKAIENLIKNDEHIATLLEQSSDIKNALLTGKEITLKTSMLNSKGVSALKSLLEHPPKMDSAIEVLAHLSEAWIKINWSLDDIRAYDSTTVGTLELEYDNSTFRKSISDPAELAAIGPNYLGPGDPDPEQVARVQRLLTRSGTTLEDEFSPDDESEPLVKDRPDDPVLKEKVKGLPDGRDRDGRDDFAYSLSSVATATSLSIVTDSLPGRHPQRWWKNIGNEPDLNALLDNIGWAFNCNWWKNGSVVEIRDRLWYKKRAAQIPDATLARWEEHTKNNQLTLDDLSEMADLTDEQVAYNIADNKVLREAYWRNAYGSLDLLKLYAQLTRSQKDAVFAGGGANLRSINSKGWKILKHLMGYAPEVLASTRIPLTLRVFPPKTEGESGWRFRVFRDSPDDIGDWTVAQPVYYDPGQTVVPVPDEGAVEVQP